jgi:CBS domain containing-hemolysin-like protein
MTPRPDVFAVPTTMTLAELTDELCKQAYSRIPAYQEDLDNIVGIAFAHDLLQIRDEDARRQTVKTILRPAAFVPETKKGYELLREMQREKQHMRIVIDEYGAVAGIVTIEDLLEQIVGSISDEHENDSAEDEAMQESTGQWVFKGSADAEELNAVYPDFNPPEDFKAQTVGGLVIEAAGRIPLPGEVVEVDGLSFEVVASTERRVERVRVIVKQGVTEEETKNETEQETEKQEKSR